MSSIKSEKEFGYLFSIIFILLNIYGVLNGWPIALKFFLLIASIIFFIVVCFFPKKLTLLCKSWLLLGEILGKVTNPLVLGFIYFLIISPVAIVARIIGRDVLKLGKKQVHDTYWENKDGTALPANSFTQQF